MGRKFAPLADRMTAYREIRKMVKAGCPPSAARIAARLEEIGCPRPSRETIRRWAMGANSPFTNLRVFEPRPSEELSFFLGAWLGDGWADTNDGGKRLLLKVRSYDFAKEFAASAARVLGKTDSYWVRRVTDKHGRWYLVKVTSLMLYGFVDQPLTILSGCIEQCPKGFLRGFFTAEGSTSISVERTPIPYLGVGVVVANTDRELLEFVRSLLAKQGLAPGAIRLSITAGKRTNLGVAQKSGWMVTLSRISCVKRFALEIGFADSVKQDKLIHALSLVEKYGTRGAVKEWLEAYDKIGKRWMEKETTTSSGQ